MENLPPLAPHHHQTEVRPAISKPSENKMTKRCLETNNATNTQVEEVWWTQFSTQWPASSLVPPCPAARFFIFFLATGISFFLSNYFIVDNQGGNGKSLDKPGEEEKEEIEEKSKRTTPS